MSKNEGELKKEVERLCSEGIMDLHKHECGRWECMRLKLDEAKKEFPMQEFPLNDFLLNKETAWFFKDGKHQHDIVEWFKKWFGETSP